MTETLKKLAELLETLNAPEVSSDEDYVSLATPNDVEKFLVEHVEELAKAEGEEQSARARHLLYAIEEINKAFDAQSWASDKFSGDVPVPAPAKLRMFKDPGQWPHTMSTKNVTSETVPGASGANYTPDSQPMQPAFTGTRSNSGDKQPPAKSMGPSGNPWVPPASNFAKAVSEATEMLKALLNKEDATEETKVADAETKTEEPTVQNDETTVVKADEENWATDLNTPEFLGEENSEDNSVFVWPDHG